MINASRTIFASCKPHTKNILAFFIALTATQHTCAMNDAERAQAYMEKYPEFFYRREEPRLEKTRKREAGAQHFTSTAAAFSPNPHAVATVVNDDPTSLYVANDQDYYDGLLNLQKIPLAHADRIHRVAYNPQGTLIVTASQDKTARIWHAATGKLVHVLEGHEHGVTDALFNHDSSHVATASNHTVRIWNTADGHEVTSKTFDTHVNNIHYNHDGSRLALSSGDSKDYKPQNGVQCIARILDAATLAVVVSLQKDGNATLPVKRVNFSNDGSKIFTLQTSRFNNPGNLDVWHGITGALLHTIHPAHEQIITDASFNYNGSHLIGVVKSRNLQKNGLCYWKTSDGTKFLDFPDTLTPVDNSLSCNGTRLMVNGEKWSDVHNRWANTPAVLKLPINVAAVNNKHGRLLTSAETSRALQDILKTRLREQKYAALLQDSSCLVAAAKYLCVIIPASLISPTPIEYSVLTKLLDTIQARRNKQ